MEEKAEKVRFVSQQDLLTMFSSILEQILQMKLGEFIKRYRDLLPGFEIVHEDELISRVFDLMAHGRDYIIVVDNKGRLRGTVTYIDILMHMGRKEERVLVTALASIAGTLKRSRIPSDTLGKLRVSMISTPMPPHVSTDQTVTEALHTMETSDSHYVVVLTPDGAVVSILTAHAVFRAAMQELRKVIC